MIVTLQNPETGEMWIGDDAQLEVAEGDYPHPTDGWELVATGERPEHPAAVPVDGAWTIPLEALKSDKLAEVKARQAEAFLAGWTHDFGEGIGVHTLDLRDADDKANWTLLLIKTQGMIAAGAEAAPVKIRTSANDDIEVTAAAANAAMIAFLAWGQAMLARKWTLDNEIEAATDETLEAIDIETWP